MIDILRRLMGLRAWNKSEYSQMILNVHDFVIVSASIVD